MFKEMFKKILPQTFFFTGLAIMPAFLFTENTQIRLVFVILIITLNLISGRNFRLFPNIVLTAGVILANLYPPGGRIYFSLGPFYFTQEAVMLGIKKSLLLIGSVYISRFSVRRELIFPGKTGALLYRTFFYFEKFTELRLDVKSDIIMQIDSRLIEIEESSAKPQTGSHSFTGKTDPGNLLFFAMVTVLFWSLFFFSKIYLRRS